MFLSNRIRAKPIKPIGFIGIVGSAKPSIPIGLVGKVGEHLFDKKI
jgi:hypothetical protein